MKTKFTRNVATLITGTAVAQALPIALSPILTRLYSPEDFGVFAVFMAVSAILTIVVTGRYELAILVPENDELAVNIVALSILLTISVSVLILAIVLVFGSQIAVILGTKKILPWLYFVPLSTLIAGCFQTLNYWNNRCSNYKKMAFSRVTQSFTASILQMGLGVFKFGSLGLIAAQILGQIFALFYLIRTTNFKRNSNNLNRLSKKNLVKVAKEYKKFPKYLILAHGFNTGSSQAPALLLSSLFSAATAGYYTLTQRVLSAPVKLVAEAIKDVFRQEASYLYAKNKECRVIYLTTLKKLFFLSFLPFSILLFTAEPLFIFIFGQDWAAAGLYASVLTPVFFLRFIASPLSAMFMIAEEQKIDLLWQIVLLALVILSIFFGSLYESILIALICFSFSYSLMFIVNLYLSYKLACGVKFYD